LDAGFAVLGIDLRNHGRRKQEYDFSDPYDYLNLGAFEAARKMISQSVLDVRRSIDYVQSRDDLSSETVSVVGFSLGAQVAYISSAIDPRIDNAVILAMPFLHPTPGLKTAFTAHEHYLPGLQDTNLLFVGATEDTFYSIAQLEALVGRVPADNAQLEIIESTHDLPHSSAELTLGFLNKAQH
jgi:pimeloyl-ACP methyl ester carboxylesterase